MSLTISTVARRAIDQMFSGLDIVLGKGADFAAARKIEEPVILDWRLAPDMWPLVRQVRIATELPARGMSRLAGAELPAFADQEKSFAELRERIVNARAHIGALPAAALDANPDADIVVPMGPVQRTFTRIDFLQKFILPNLYFHATATYLILRHLGVEVGKMDYLAAPRQG